LWRHGLWFVLGLLWADPAHMFDLMATWNHRSVLNPRAAHLSGKRA
jgi:hypothetical protein